MAGVEGCGVEGMGKDSSGWEGQDWNSSGHSLPEERARGGK